jgi:ATP-dependent Clp protease ATP-binding subunit ClpC
MVEFAPRDDLNPGANSLVQEALRTQAEHGHEALTSKHWLLALLKRHGKMAEALVDGLDAKELAGYVREQVRKDDIGDRLDADTLVEQAVQRARSQGKDRAAERDMAAVILQAAGYEVLEAMVASSKPAVGATPSSALQLGEPGGYRSRAKRPTPTIEKFGRDLTQLAQEGSLPRIVGREREIEGIIRALCRRTKRNPALVGPAGVGKTAIVEGLAQQIVAGEVPEPLRGVRLLELVPSNLTAGASMVGELQKRMKAILKEASQDGVVLFIDELHSIVGAGGVRGTEDIGSLLKPALARGDLACIGATTDDEYRRFIEPDRALERRFNPIAVHETSPEVTLMIMGAHREKLTDLRKVQVRDEVLQWLVDFAKEYLRNRTFPDKAVDLLEQCVATAVVKGESEVDLPQAQAVAQEMLGMPIDLNQRLDALESEINQSGLLTADDTGALLDRLNVTLRGLDLHPLRPAAVVLLTAEAASTADALAETLADTLFGGPDRIVNLDFSQFDGPEDVNTLVGPPPGYIGFEGRRPLHAVSQMPRSVLLVKNVHGCHPEVREVFGQALSDGVVAERGGGRIYLSDAVVLMTAAAGGEVRRTIAGFGRAQEDDTVALELGRAAEAELGAGFVEWIDLIFARVPAAKESRERWVERNLLARISDQYRSHGMQLEWEKSVINWILKQEESHPTRADLTRVVEDRLGEALIPHLPKAGAGEVQAVLSAKKGAIQVKLKRSGGGTERG